MQRWTSSYRFEWTPIVTFGRRQIRFLDWIEENLEPVAFYDQVGVTGVALVSRNVRLTLDQRGMTLQDGSAVDAGVSLLMPAVRGVFEILEPKGAQLHSASVAWSRGIDHVAYNEARASLARSISRIGLNDSGPLAIDVSALMDIATPAYKGQVEWGVVSADELIDRLSVPEAGRLSSNRPEAELPGIDAGDLPESSLFVDTSFRATSSELIDSAQGIADAVDDVNRVSMSTADAIFAGTEELWGKK
ncbi:hypothetical protein LPW41_11675 [Microbacterium sp. JC 701]|uniref:hypothetical protein n=1 Tax=Microbacterium sp. JC 701 TaxID=2897389 RepID=UPI001E2CAA1F|nr:hypothetical protein [Microbacterium sp. JC 701]MCD2170356.1 hypothetical protein [Microbacterium sp. JC 701]